VSVPRELRALRAATDVYLSTLREIEPALEQWADVHRFTEPTYGRLLDEVRRALVSRQMGTPAAVARVAAELPHARA
jgi:hypothetical protein